MNTPAQNIIEKLGGAKPTAEMAGVSFVTVYRWKNGEFGHGYIPVQYHQKILDNAVATGIDLTREDFWRV